jgi:two-component system, OmpR family, sensor histidine kinase BaeS
MRLSSKLFLSLLGLTTVILIATLSLARWSFERGFIDFISSQEGERLQYVADELIFEYSLANNSWHAVKQTGLNTYLRRHFKNRPQDHLPIGQLRPPPPIRMPLIDNDAAKRREIGPPTVLVDAHNHFVAGDQHFANDISDINVPLYLSDQKIGELRSWPKNLGNSPLASAFSKQQLWTSMVIGAICLLLACIMSWLLTRIFLTPLRQVLKGVSKLSKGEYQLRFSHQRKDELGQLMDDVQNLSNVLAKNRSAKNRWLADISHELRTPLTILSGEIDALKAGIRPFNQQQLDSLEQETTRLRHLVDDLYQLSLSDIGGLRYHFSNIDPCHCLANVLGTMTHAIEEKGLQLVVACEEAQSVSADPQRLEQLFINLLSNALHYTDAPGRIEINMLTVNQQIIIELNDSAPSVNQEECELLFEPLFRKDSARTRRSAGAGLGLSICRNIVHAHQGSIRAFPNSIGGLGIHITMPKKRETL